MSFCLILFCIILLGVILFCDILFLSVGLGLLCFVSFCLILVYSILSSVILFRVILKNVTFCFFILLRVALFRGILATTSLHHSALGHFVSYHSEKCVILFFSFCLGSLCFVAFWLLLVYIILPSVILFRVILKNVSFCTKSFHRQI
jgi:hypothetical protein